MLDAEPTSARDRLAAIMASPFGMYDLPATEAYNRGEVSVPWAEAQVESGDIIGFVTNGAIALGHVECCGFPHVLPVFYALVSRARGGATERYTHSRQPHHLVTRIYQDSFDSATYAINVMHREFEKARNAEVGTTYAPE